MDPYIVTERLTLRAARPEDVDQMLDLVSDFEVVRQTSSWPWPADRDFTLNRCHPVPLERGMAGVVTEGGRVIGTMAALEGEQFGYMLARDTWGKGYATEMGRAFTHRIFAQYDWPGIWACVFDDNPASARVLEKLGFAEGPACEGECVSRGGVFPTRTFTLDRPEA